MDALVHLTTSTQLLFGTLARLAARLSAKAEDTVQSLPHFLRALPASLQLLTLTEHWDAADLGAHDAGGLGILLVLDAWHAQGDWMEARFADEQARAGDMGLRSRVKAQHQCVLLELVIGVCEVWLRDVPRMRALELRPQAPEFYSECVHPVVMDPVEGVDGKLLTRVVVKEGLDFWRYAFV